MNKVEFFYANIYGFMPRMMYFELKPDGYLTVEHVYLLPDE